MSELWGGGESFTMLPNYRGPHWWGVVGGLLFPGQDYMFKLSYIQKRSSMALEDYEKRF